MLTSFVGKCSIKVTGLKGLCIIRMIMPSKEPTTQPLIFNALHFEHKIPTST